MRFRDKFRQDLPGFQIAPMVPNMSFSDSGTDRSIFLGVNVPGYKVHSLAFAMEYRF